MLVITTKTFSDLTTLELYELLKLRSEVFVVEQDCVYQDIDDKDQKALHVIGMKAERMVAYARIFKPGDYFELASIGRVVVLNEERKFGYGLVIMKNAIEVIQKEFMETSIRVSAQVYLKKFYESLGFNPVGEGYLEDGIPHISMIKEN